MELSQQLRQFITSNFYVADTAGLKDDASLLDAGIVDSTGILEIITFIEGEFGITVEDNEMVPENLDSIKNLTAFVSKKRG